MEHIKLFIELTRLKKPIGYMLLFWPCAWGLTLAYDFNEERITYIFYLLLFFFGSVLMRSAGCIVNDIVDKQFDKKVFRTKNRPIAKEQISVMRGIIYSLFLCLIAFIILIKFNYLTIILAIGSMPLAFIYPFMKRYTYWPQLFLGITFNYGLVLGWTSIENNISIETIILYFGAVFWTLGYDTIYGYQDINDDEVIGLKSTSIRFKSYPYTFLKVCYSIFYICIIVVGIIMKFNLIYYLLSILVCVHLFYNQIFSLDVKDPNSCLKIFKSNNILGLLIFFTLMVGNF